MQGGDKHGNCASVGCLRHALECLDRCSSMQNMWDIGNMTTHVIGLESLAQATPEKLSIEANFCNNLWLAIWAHRCKPHKHPS